MHHSEHQARHISELVSVTLFTAIVLIILIQLHIDPLIEHAVELSAVLLMYRYFWSWSHA